MAYLENNSFNPGLFVSIFHQLKLELLTQFPASNDEKYLFKSRHPRFNYLIPCHELLEVWF